MTAKAKARRPDDDSITHIEALRWLQGTLTPGSPQELQGRRALAQLLRTDMPPEGMLIRLAHMIDPNGASDVRLVIKRRPHRPQQAADSAIGSFIWTRLHTDCEPAADLAAAVEDAKKYFNVKRSKVLSAWKKWQQGYTAASISIGKDGRPKSKK